MRPAQIDSMGASNNVCIGPYDRPRVRLPGAAGIPDASTAARRFYYYAPRHTRQLFVEKLDFCSGAGHPGAGESGNPQMVTVITNLCVMSSGSDGRLRVTHLHEGVTRAEVDENTGFALGWEASPAVTQPPSADQLRILNDIIDPRGLRFLEALTGAARRERLRALTLQGVNA
jgi:acyl CoA:acetate/3-ketoacid CoA transferase beta subunit